MLQWIGILMIPFLILLVIIVFLLSMIMVGIYEIKDLLKWMKSLREEVAKIR